MTIVDLGGNRWQARLRYKEDGAWKRDSRNFEAASRRAARAEGERLAAAHICRYLSLRRVDELVPQDVLAIQEGLLEDGLCPNTVTRAHRFLKQAMAYAVDMGSSREPPSPGR